MPWFSRKKKRKQKKVVVNTTKDDAVVTATSKPAFAVVVQSFESLVSDQISVERGQVVEALFTEDDWIFVRNVNGNCGYIPGNFCFPLEKLRMGLPEESGDRVRQLRAHPRPTTIHVDTFNDHPTGGEEEGGEREEDAAEEEEVNSPDSGISCSHQASSSNVESVPSLHTTRERLVTSRPAVNEGAELHTSHTHPVRKPGRHKRFLMPNSSLPLLETISQPVTEEHDTLPHSPSPPPLQPVSLADTPGHTHTAATATVADGNYPQSVSSDGGDDVFLPEANKPLGIYQCSETYDPQFEGEIPVQRDEVVVVLEAGRGEWVWALGSEGKEGLILKSLLHKYRPDLPEEGGGEEDEGEEIDIGEEERGEEVGGERVEVSQREEATATTITDTEILTSSSATQTELIVDGVIHELTSCCVPSGLAPAATSPTQETASVSIQTEFTLPNWFRNNTPVATPCHTLTRSSATPQEGVSPPVATETSQCQNSHSQNVDSQPQQIPSGESSAPLRLLCNPRSSQSSGGGAEGHSRHSGVPAGVRALSGCGLPLTPAPTPPQPSVTLQTPSGSHAPRTLVSGRGLAGGRGGVVTGPTEQAPPQQPPQQQQQQQPQQQQPPQQQQQQQSGRERSGQTRLAPRGGVPTSGTGTIQRQRQALQQHTRIVSSIPFEPDNEATPSSSSSSARRRMQPTPIVTATRDFSPPQQARNALTLRRGEIMYAQPHVPFPHGWVWVYHPLHKRYGYVPKDHIAYMYLVQKDRGAVLEDVV